jgi:flagellar protein FliO/FliZ
LLVIGALLGLLDTVARRRAGFAPLSGASLGGDRARRPGRHGMGAGRGRRPAGRGLRNLFGRVVDIGVGFGVGFARLGGGATGGRLGSLSIQPGADDVDSPSIPRVGDDGRTATDRRSRSRFGGRRAPRTLEVVDRQSLSRTTSMAVVRVGRRAYLVGATEASLSLLADVSDELEPAAAVPVVAAPVLASPVIEAPAPAFAGPALAASASALRDEEAERAALEESLRQWTGAPAGPNGLRPSRMELVETVFHRLGLPG